MEASAVLKMVEDVFYNSAFIVEVIVSDDDSTMHFCAQASFDKCLGSSSEDI